MKNIKLNRIFVILIGTIMMVTLAYSSFKSTAAEEKLYVALSRVIPDQTYGYAIGNPAESVGEGKTIWNLVSYTDSTFQTTKDFSKSNLYCLKAGAGFYNENGQSDANGKKTYTRLCSISDKQTMSSSTHKYVKELADGENYNKVRWLLDNIFIKGESTETDKKKILYEAGISQANEEGEPVLNGTGNYYYFSGGDYDYTSDADIGTLAKGGYTAILTDEDLVAMQQAAIWFFTNGNDNAYNKYASKNWEFITEDSSKDLKGTYSTFSTKYASREEQSRIVYKYLIDAAKKNADSYQSETAKGDPITINKNNANLSVKQDNFVLGPINITKNNNTPYEIQIKVSNESDTQINNYKFVDANGTQLSNFDINKYTGDFYIAVPVNTVNKIKINLNILYEQRDAYVYVEDGATEDQPIVIPETDKKNIPIELELSPKKEFDLKLIKRIVKVNNQEVPERLLNVDVSKLNRYENGKLVTTAEYKMEKDPVSVKKGDIVTYTFRVYNEGYIDGYASEITEDIPEGLEFIWSEKTGEALESDTTLTEAEKEAIKFNKSMLWKNIAGTNTITTTYLSKGASEDNLIKAFGENDGNKTAEDLKYKEVSVMLKVKDTATANSIIRNEAEISEDTDANGSAINDRDSDTEKWGKEDSDKYYKEDNKWHVYKEDDEDYDNIIIVEENKPEFDLKLIKRIVKVNNQEVPERLLNVDVSKLNRYENGKLVTTAEYKMEKDPVSVKKGDIVTYTFRVYNEGYIDGYASEITEDIPEGLEFIWSEKTEEELESDTTLTEAEKEAIKFNKSMLWKNIAGTNTITTTYLSKEASEDNLIKAFGENDGTKTEEDLDYKEVSVMLKVKDTATANSIIRNEAEISEDTDANGSAINDRDSDTEKWGKEDSDKYYKEDNKWHVYKEDDEDYDNIILVEEKPEFDLKLIKRIVKVNGKEVPERLLNVDVSKLNRYEDGKLVTTAEYEMDKTPVLVKKGDIVTYTFRIYNEGYIDGYASEITEDIPEGLEFIWSEKTGEDLKNDTTLTEAEKEAIEFNQSMLWKYADKDLKTITTTYLSKEASEDNLIKAFGENDGTKTEEDLDYKEVSVMLKVVAENSYNGIIRNEAEISEDTDGSGNTVNDRDSDTEKWVKYEDDEDYDNVKLQYFDLALRKFITAVEDEAVTSRIPVVTYKNGKLVYTHPKDPLLVHVGDVVTYTIRVFNEGKIDGYAEEVTDDIPEYLEYLPDNKINKEYRWVMKDKDGKEVTDVSKANKVTTDYLSSAQEKETKRNNLLKAFDSNAKISETNPDYRDLKIAFKVKDPNSNKYIITNHAQISEDSDDDIDSTPGEWNEGEDDQDIENVKVQYFDLALRKYVTKAIVIENGKQTVTNTGHKAEDDPESIVKVELHRKKLSSVTVKFVYRIKITNQGDIEGYAKEITDYIPAGLKFVAKDNPDWKDEGNNVISTRKLENTLLQPGESAEVEVTLTWINGSDNTGLKINTAEISDDWNKYKLKDRDSTPDNKKPGEDDIDDAPVMLSISTGQIRIYYLLGTTILVILAGGIFLIKKYII